MQSHTCTRAQKKPRIPVSQAKTKVYQLQKELLTLMRPAPDYNLADISQKLYITGYPRKQKRAGDEIRTHDIHVGNVTLYRWATPAKLVS